MVIRSLCKLALAATLVGCGPKSEDVPIVRNDHCPVGGCEEKGDRLDDSEPEPRCPVHSVRMQRL